MNRCSPLDPGVHLVSDTEDTGGLVKPRALVTGGAGFVGSHLAEALLEDEWAVEVIDDLSTGSRSNIAHLEDRDGFCWTVGSVLDRDVLARLIERADVVYHLAAAVGVQLIVDSPIRAIQTNIRGTEMVLELAARKGARVLITSTSEVYGKGGGRALREDDDSVLGPTSRSRWCYATSNMIDEFLTLGYVRECGLSATVVRLFSTIGPRQSGRYGMVVPRFVTQAIAGRPITVYGDGTQRRSFTWVGDIVRALTALVHHPAAVGEVFNVGHTSDISIGELARLVKSLTGSPSEIVFIPFDEAYGRDFEDVPRSLPDIAKLQRLVGYQPTLELPEMVRRIVEHHRGAAPGRAVA